MSCYPGMPCYDAFVKTTYLNDECDPCTNKIINSNKIEYRGANLPCTGINTCDTVELALQKIDNKICSDDLVAQILNTIKNDETLLAYFCEMVSNCILTTSTTTTTI